MKIKVVLRWCMLGALVLGLGLPQVAAAGAAKGPPAKADQVKATPGTLKPVVAAPANFGITKPLKEIAAERSAQTGPILTHRIHEVPNQPTPRDEEETFRSESTTVTHERDGALQTFSPIETMPAPAANFDGVSNADNLAAFGFRLSPPDTNGAVGPNHFVQTVNLLVGIYDKAGVLLIPKFKMSALFASLGAPCGTLDNGDPIALYDRMADRWILSQFVLPNYPNGPFYQEIAISQSGDPTGAYYIYCFMVHATKMNDYPHFGIWPDGYYMTAHQFNPSYAGQGVWAFDRTKMLAGDPTASFIYFDLNALDPAIGGMLPADADGFVPPPVGAPDVFAYPLATEWGDAVDGMRLFNFHADWAVPANSTFTERAESPIATAAYDPRNPSGRLDVSQPAPATATMYVDSISDRYMHRLQYRNFGGSESLIACQTVDAAVWPAWQAGVRYCQLKNASLGGAFSPNEQATFAPDTDHRWMGSAACDWQGNLAVGYSVSSLTTFPSVRYAGRLVSDPPNQLTQGEAALVAGTGVQRSTSNRWGDYSALTLDPTDDATFWYTQEYYTAASQATSTVGWLTRVGSFKFAGVPSSPRGALNVTVTNCNTAAAMSGVSVSTSNGYFRTSNGSGLAAFAIMAPGSYTVTASAPGYLPATGAVTVSNGGTATLNLCLTAVPVITADSAVLTSEACVPPNGVIDPNEQVTVNFCVKNMGAAASSNLVATLQNSGGVVLASAPVTYGVISVGGTGCGNFTFAANYTLACGSTLTATIHFQDGAYDLGNVTYTFTLGILSSLSYISENFDGVTAPSLPAGWTTSASGADVPWVTTIAQANTAPNSAFTSDPAAVGEASLVTPTVAVTTSVNNKLTFKNYYNTESTFDGGVLEVSVDGGGWQDIVAAGGTFAAGGYNGTISSSFSNPLAGRSAWTGNSAGFITSTVNLPASWSGHSVAFRFRAGSDNSVSATGWYVDGVSFTSQSYQCCVCPPITIAPAALPSTIVGLPYNQTLSASGTSGPYTYAVTAGTLPPGITLSAGGLLSGLPTSKLSFAFTVTATDAAGCSGMKAYTLAASTLYFLDDAGRDRMCVNAATGAYTFQILTGPHAGESYTGIANIMNGGTKIYSKPGAADYLNFTYDAIRKRAAGYFMSAAGVYSVLADYNTANNTGGCS